MCDDIKKDLKTFLTQLTSNERYKNTSINLDKNVEEFYRCLQFAPSMYYNIENNEGGYDKYFMGLKEDKIEIQRLK
jgi:hypothetical protein